MATARKPGASRPKPKRAHPKPGKAAKARTPVRGSAAAKPAAKPKIALKAKPAGKTVARVIGKPAVAGKSSVIGKPAGIGKPAVAGKPGTKVVGKPAVAGKPGAKVVGKPAVAGKGAVLAARKPGKVVIRVVDPKPKANVRPIGALPPEAVARATRTHTPVIRRDRPQTRPVRDLKTDQGTQGVTEKDFAEFEQLLILERRRIMKDMGYLENTVLKVNQRDSAGDLSGYSFHMADVGTDAMEREKAFLFASTEGRLLLDITEALRKVYAGEFGKCEICEKPIARARLEAMPYARLCLSCKEKQERENRGVS